MVFADLYVGVGLQGHGAGSVLISVYNATHGTLLYSVFLQDGSYFTVHFKLINNKEIARYNRSIWF